MKIKANILVCLLTLSSVTSVYAKPLMKPGLPPARPAEEDSIKAEVDKKSITTDETINYKLTIVCSERNIPLPELPEFEDFMVLSQVNSSVVSIAEGKIKSNIVYAYILAPKKMGLLKIEPAKIKIKDKAYSTEAFGIEVKQGKEKIQTPPEEEKPGLKESLPESEEPQITL